MQVYYPKLGEYPESPGDMVFVKFANREDGMNHTYYLNAFYSKEINVWTRLYEWQPIIDEAVKWCYMRDMVPDVMK